MGILAGSDTALVDYGDLAEIDGATLLTGMVWLYPTALNDDVLMKKGKNGALPNWDPFGVTIGTNGSIAFRYSVAGANELALSGVGAIIVNVWQNIAFVYNGAGATDVDKLKIYVNAVSLVLTYTAAVPAALGSQANNLTLGGALSDNLSIVWGTQRGHYALFKMWLAELSAAEVANEMRSFRPVRQGNLYIYSTLDAESGVDHSGNGRNGTLTDFVGGNTPPVGRTGIILS